MRQTNIIPQSLKDIGNLRQSVNYESQISTLTCWALSQDPHDPKFNTKIFEIQLYQRRAEDLFFGQ